LKRDPFQAGGAPDPSNPGIACPTRVRTVAHWFNPCAFANPLNGNLILNGTQVAGAAANIFVGGKRGEVYGPGYERIDMSVFKGFSTFGSQRLEFRADIFNFLNTPGYGTPAGSIGSNGGQITSSRTFGNNQPDARFVQLALKYFF
jgi:hypothetical protein